MRNLIQIEEKCIPAKIFEKARYLFNRIGVRNTTMDDLAKELGISKKTLYKEIDNKADLVKLCIQYDLKRMEEKIQEISSSYENAIEELLVINDTIIEDIKVYHPTMLHDLTKFYPESCELIENHKASFAQKSISGNLEKGIQQGLYRKDINTSLVTLFQLNLSTLPLEQTHLGYDTKLLYSEILKYNIYAIATPKGIEIFNQLTKKQSS